MLLAAYACIRAAPARKRGSARQVKRGSRRLFGCSPDRFTRSEHLLGTPRMAYWPEKCSQVFPESAKYAMPPFWGAQGRAVLEAWAYAHRTPWPPGLPSTPSGRTLRPEGGEPSSRACRAVRPSRHCHASRSSQLPIGAAARVWPAVPSLVVPFRHFPGKRGVWCLLLLSFTSVELMPVCFSRLSAMTRTDARVMGKSEAFRSTPWPQDFVGYHRLSWRRDRGLPCYACRVFWTARYEVCPGTRRW